MTFGQTLKRFRERTPGHSKANRFGPAVDHLSQNQLARRSGFNAAYINRLERDEREPTRAAVVALADGLGLSDLDTSALLRAAGYLPMRRTA